MLKGFPAWRGEPCEGSIGKSRKPNAFLPKWEGEMQTCVVRHPSGSAARGGEGGFVLPPSEEMAQLWFN